MILSVCLNASIDKTYVVESFDVGSITRAKDVISTAGGKGINVAKTISALGQNVLATGFIGGFSGMFIQQELQQKHVPFEFTQINGETRNCINIIDQTTHTHTELLEPGPEIENQKIKEIISKDFKIKIEDFNSKKRTRAIAYPRQVAMYLTRELTDLSLPKIGDEFGGRDHTTVIHAYDKIETDINESGEFKNRIDELIKEIKGE